MSTTTLYSMDESSIHPMDLLSLARHKYLALDKDDEIQLHPKVLQSEFMKSLRRHSRAPARILAKRGMDSETSENVEPATKRKKDNLMGPFSAEDFLSHSYSEPLIDFSALSSSNIIETPKRHQKLRRIEIASRKKETDVFQRLSTPKSRK